MAYGDLWNKIKDMKPRERNQLAYEMRLKGFNVSNMFPHYYQESKALHDIESFATRWRHTYYK